MHIKAAQNLLRLQGRAKKYAQIISERKIKVKKQY